MSKSLAGTSSYDIYSNVDISGVQIATDGQILSSASNVIDQNYEFATKKYVDDKDGAIVFNDINGVSTVGQSTGNMFFYAVSGNWEDTDEMTITPGTDVSFKNDATHNGDVSMTGTTPHLVIDGTASSTRNTTQWTTLGMSMSDVCYFCTKSNVLCISCGQYVVSTGGNDIRNATASERNVSIILYKAGAAATSPSMRVLTGAAGTIDAVTSLTVAFDLNYQGDLSISGTYSPFTGSHKGKSDGNISKSDGDFKVIIATGNLDTESVPINTICEYALASTASDRRVVGVSRWTTDPDDETIDVITSLSVGEGSIWVTNYNGDIDNGDLITSSVIEGYGQKQGDDYMMSWTVAKATESVDWSTITDTIDYDGVAYKKKLIACTYHCG